MHRSPFRDPILPTVGYEPDTRLKCYGSVYYGNNSLLLANGAIELRMRKSCRGGLEMTRLSLVFLASQLVTA